AGSSVPGGKAKSLIFLWLQGGPSHLETWDLKPDAASEYRGTFRPIPTRADGIQISEHLPHCASVMESMCLLRTITGPEASHERASRHLQTGWRPIPNIDYPSLPANYVKWKPTRRDVPPFVGVLNPIEQGFGGGFLGPTFSPFLAGDPSLKEFAVRDLVPPQGVPLDRVTRRKDLLSGFDASFRALDRNSASLTPALETAYRIVYSPTARRAFDLHQEPDSLRDRYGRTPLGQACLLARRLVEGGVQAVSIFKGGWDTHGKNCETLKDKLLPELDPALATLVFDLKQRGLLDSTLVVCLGEFGRTPKINGSAGRDHWPRAGSIALAGGGVRGGQAIGETDAIGSEPKSRPIPVEAFAATVYQALGVDYHQLNHTPEGRPVRIVEETEPVLEAFGR
ncbi:MAG: DUF1501 domain-containing protein, partial [Armatimonadetes bacterium]|nr:DUF1501 domain-containing protein [Armatimonadota bacterium]